MGKFQVTIAVVFLTACWSVPVRSEVMSLTLDVDGLACPFCAYGLEKKLKKVEGVVKLKIDVEAGRVDLTIRPGARLGDSQKLGLVSLAKKAVKDGGFTAREVRATVDGTLKGVSGEWRLEVPKTGEVLALDGNGKDTELQSGAGSHLMVSGLLVDDGGRVTLTIEKIDRSANASVSRVQLKITGLVCSGCADAVRAALEGVPGVQSAAVDLEESLAEVQVEGRVTPDQLVAAINAASMDGMSEGTFKASVVQ